MRQNTFTTSHVNQSNFVPMTQSICSDYSTEGVGNRGNWTRGEYDKHNLGQGAYALRH
jgi:hypothetical protein